MRLFTWTGWGGDRREPGAGQPSPPRSPVPVPRARWLTLSRYLSRIWRPQLEQRFLAAAAGSEAAEEEEAGEPTDGVDGVLGAEPASSLPGGSAEEEAEEGGGGGGGDRQRLKPLAIAAPSRQRAPS